MNKGICKGPDTDPECTSTTRTTGDSMFTLCHTDDPYFDITTFSGPFHYSLFYQRTMLHIHLHGCQSYEWAKNKRVSFTTLEFYYAPWIYTHYKADDIAQ